jgi:hypothetical protein
MFAESESVSVSKSKSVSESESEKNLCGSVFEKKVFGSTTLLKSAIRQVGDVFP